MALGEVDGGERLGDGADLVDLDQDRVGHAQINALAEELDVGDEQIVADELDLAAELFGQQFPAVPIAFGAAVFDGDDRELLAPALVHGDHVGGGTPGLVALGEDVLLGFGVEELAGGDIEGDEDILAGLVAGGLDGLDEDFEGGGVAGEGGGESAFVADGGGQALALEDLLEGVEDLGAHAQAFGEGGGAAGHDHEFLDVNGGVGVGAAVDDVHHRHGQDMGVESAEVAVQRDFEGGGGGAGHGHGDAEHGVGAELGLGLGAVEGDHGGIHGGLVAGIHADDRLGDQGIDVLDGLEGALAEIALLVAVAQFEGFIGAGRGAGGHGGAAEDAAGEDDIGFEGGIAAGIQDFAGMDGGNVEHGIFSCRLFKVLGSARGSGVKGVLYTPGEERQLFCAARAAQERICDSWLRSTIQIRHVTAVAYRKPPSAL